jgi:class 3 adenylate cyclase
MSDRPTGNVTFLFTDIEGSTQLLHALGERYGEVLAAQQAIVRDAFARHGGFEVDTQGDSFFYAFQRAGDALQAAVRAQRILLSHPWIQDVKVRVRMGLHTGAPAVANDRYIGIDVHRAARVGSAGHGAQVLLTEATRYAAADEMPAGVSLRDLGPVRLKDLKSPEHIYQLVALDLPADFPPLKTLDSLDAHFETLARALAKGRVIPFFGPGVNLSGRAGNAAWQSGDADVVPHNAELADYLARSFDYPRHEPRDLIRVSQYIAVKQGIGPLYDELRALFQVEYPPNALHRFFAELPRHLRERGHRSNLLLITTNFDDTLERALHDAAEPFDVVYYAADGEHQGKFIHVAPDGKLRVIDKPNKYLNVSPEQRTVVLKMHGILDRTSRTHDSYVITEDHYIDFLAHKDIDPQLPAKLLEKMNWSHFLFLGYNLRDWNLRVILHRIWGEEKFKYKSWAVQPRVLPLDKEFWAKRDADVIEISLDDYVGALSEQLDTLPRAGGDA